MSTIQEQKFYYAPQLRPARCLTLPCDCWEFVERGVYDELPLRTDLPLGQHKFGVVSFDRKLTPTELKKYSLKRVNK